MESKITTHPIGSNSIQNATERKANDISNYEVLPEGMRSIGKKKRSSLMALILPEDVPDITTYLKKRKDDIIKYVVWPKVKEILLESFSTVLGVNITARRPGERGEIQKINYANQYSFLGSSSSKASEPVNKKSYIMYQDLYFNTEDDCKKFKELISDLFDDQGGYIRVLQYMNQAGEETFPEQWNYGWTSLNGFKYRYTVNGWLVSMSYPIPLDF